MIVTPKEVRRAKTKSGAVHVATTQMVLQGKSTSPICSDDPSARERPSHIETLGNLSHLPDNLIEIIKRSLKGETFVPAAENTFRITRSWPHGHVDAVLTMIRKLGGWSDSSPPSPREGPTW